MKHAITFIAGAVVAAPALAAAVAPTVGVPTLDEVGLVGLVALIGVVGGFLARRRRK